MYNERGRPVGGTYQAWEDTPVKRFVILAVVLAVVLSVSPAWSKTVRATDSTGALSVVVPNGWKENKSGAGGTKLILVGPKHEGFTTNINLMIEKVPAMSLADYEKLSKRNAPKMMDNYKLLSSRGTTLGGVPARQWVCTGSGGNPIRHAKCRNAFGIKDGTAYILTFTSLEAYYDKHVGAFDSVVKSLKWLKGKASPPAQRPKPKAPSR
jgi:hypothetical protein